MLEGSPACPRAAICGHCRHFSALVSTRGTVSCKHNPRAEVETWAKSRPMVEGHGGACWPPPPARHRTRAPASGGNQLLGTGRRGVRTISHRPSRAAATTSRETGIVHSFPRSTRLSQARRLYSIGSIMLCGCPARTARLSLPRLLCPACYRLRIRQRLEAIDKKWRRPLACEI